MVEFNATKEVIETVKDISTGDTLTSVVQGLPPDVVTKFGTLIFLAKTLGVLFIIYIIFLIIRSIFTIKNGLRIKEIHKKVYSIEEKINQFLKEKEQKKDLKKSKEKINEVKKEKK